MAGVRQLKTGKWEVSFAHALLPKKVTKNMPDEAKARAYAEQGQALLDAGIVPPGFVKEAPEAEPVRHSLAEVILKHLNSGAVAASDQFVLGKLRDEVGHVLLGDVTFRWCERWVHALKVKQNLSPGTIRKRVGSLSRAIAMWTLRFPDFAVTNHLAYLPKRYSHYTAADIAELDKAGGKKRAKIDVSRDRRLHPGEEDKILAVLSGEKRADRERPLNLPEGDAMKVFFMLILHTGARLVEAYTLTRGQILLGRNIIQLRTSKLKPGQPVKYRNVGIRPELKGALSDWLAAKGMREDNPTQVPALVFPFWSGTAGEIEQCGHKLSQRFRNVFEYAQCEGLVEHDLRHEATCRLFEDRTAEGAHMFRTEEINRLMGWSDKSVMAQRYASFRTEDLAARFWSDHPEDKPAVRTALRAV